MKYGNQLAYIRSVRGVRQSAFDTILREYRIVDSTIRVLPVAESAMRSKHHEKTLIHNIIHWNISFGIFFAVPQSTARIVGRIVGAQRAAYLPRKEMTGMATVHGNRTHTLRSLRDLTTSRRTLLTGTARLAGGAALALALNAAPFAARLQTVGAASAPDMQMQAVLDALAAFNAPELPMLTPEQARNAPSFKDALLAVQAQRGVAPVEPVAKVSHLLIPNGGDGLLARVYTPTGTGPFPVLVYFHGGGWVIADLDTYDGSCRGLANMAQCIVVSVAYRLAPEHPFPAAPIDAVASTQWVQQNAASFGGDPTRVAVGGESAGGNLAAVTALAIRNAGGTMPVHQLLVYPVVGFSLDAPSFTKNANAKPLSTAAIQWFGKYYQPDPSSFLASPVTQDLSGLPPATIINADIDPLRDGGPMYAMRLQQAGVAVTQKTFMGVTHEFFGMGSVVDTAKQAMQMAAMGLRTSFGN